MKQNLGLKYCFSPVPLLSEGQKWSIDLQNASKWWPSLSHPLGVFCFWNCDWVHWHFDFPRRILQIALSFGDSRSMSHTTAVVNALACEEAEFQFSHQWKNEPAFLMHGLMVSICPCILRRMWKALFISMPLSFLQTEAFTSFKAFTTVNLHDNVDWKNTMSLDMIFCQCHPGRQPTWLHQWEIWILSPWTHHWLMWLLANGFLWLHWNNCCVGRSLWLQKAVLSSPSHNVVSRKCLSHMKMWEELALFFPCLPLNCTLAWLTQQHILPFKEFVSMVWLNSRRSQPTKQGQQQSWH